MKLFRFLFSKLFVYQLLIALLLIFIIVFAALSWLDSTTNHDQRIEVPDLSKLSLEVVEQELEAYNLRYVVVDSANYNPDYPIYSVIEQNPKPGKNVKENRKIYLTLNPSGYAKIEIPEIEGRTKRQVIPTLKSIGFEIGEITYKPNLAKDAVIGLRHNGKAVKAGERLPKTSVIDLVLGDGSRNYNSEE
ncbi:PASTA domain-containing protein [uncultured Mesonia sp.]|uniref:PASTA domain-containing protein n=1 Tax=uncultured Mesonia sp. TaxID=399731 RepID=UPI00374E737E